MWPPCHPTERNGPVSKPDRVVRVFVGPPRRDRGRRPSDRSQSEIKPIRDRGSAHAESWPTRGFLDGGDAQKALSLDSLTCIPQIIDCGAPATVGHSRGLHPSHCGSLPGIHTAMGRFNVAWAAFETLSEGSASFTVTRSQRSTSR